MVTHPGYLVNQVPAVAHSGEHTYTSPSVVPSSADNVPNNTIAVPTVTAVVGNFELLGGDPPHHSHNRI